MTDSGISFGSAKAPATNTPGLEVWAGRIGPVLRQSQIRSAPPPAGLPCVRVDLRRSQPDREHHQVEFFFVQRPGVCYIRPS